MPAFESVGQHGGYDAALWRASVRLQWVFLARLQHSCFEPFADQPREGSVVHPLL